MPSAPPCRTDGEVVCRRAARLHGQPFREGALQVRAACRPHARAGNHPKKPAGAAHAAGMPRGSRPPAEPGQASAQRQVLPRPSPANPRRGSR